MDQLLARAVTEYADQISEQQSTPINWRCEPYDQQKEMNNGFVILQMLYGKSIDDTTTLEKNQMLLSWVAYPRFFLMNRPCRIARKIEEEFAAA